MAINDDDSIVNPIQVQKFLRGINYPTNKRTIIETAKREGADERVIRTLEKMDGDEYNSPNDVTEAIGKLS